MKYYKMSMDGHLAAVVSEDDLKGDGDNMMRNREAMEAAGWDFEEVKCVEPPPNSGGIEVVCSECGYKMWVFKSGEEPAGLVDADVEGVHLYEKEIRVDCDICESEYVLTQVEGKWQIGVVPDDQITMTDEEV